ncbi:MAG TPA: SMP-30/gluconolactonase/LRE family protein [Candidatus Polarisedimenticolaceae bacterium]|nr:SMP-30/gluconolactonase/LRE family protein [Candidatus Polarisedimenticolaceae bacterium]
MAIKTMLTIICLLWISTTLAAESPKATVLVDLDPNSSAQTVIIESVASDPQGLIYVCDRVTGNVLRVDPKKPSPVIVGRVETRQVDGKSARADSSGLIFNEAGDLYLTSGGFREILRIRKTDLNPEKPGVAETFATGTEGANGIAFDKKGNLYVSGGRNGKIYRIGPTGGAAEDWAQIELHTRTLADGKTQQAIPANGLVFDSQGTVLYVADTARGAIWKITIGSDGKPGKPSLMAQSALLEGADGPAFDSKGNLWVAANERNAIVEVTPDGKVRDVIKNDSKGPLEFPTAVIFVGNTAYVSNFDTARRDNLAADGKTSLDGIGASIIQITP